MIAKFGMHTNMASDDCGPIFVAFIARLKDGLDVGYNVGTGLYSRFGLLCVEATVYYLYPR